MTTKENKEIVRRMINILNSRDLSNLEEICDEKFVYRANYEIAAQDLNTYKGLLQLSFESFPDLEFSLEDIFSEGDKVHMIYKMEGSHEGEYLGIPPSNNKIDHGASSVLTVKNGKITEQHDFYDMLTFLKDLGAVSEEVRPDGKEWPTGGTTLGAR